MAENEAQEPRQTRTTILEELNELGYTGPTSYSKPRLIELLEDVKAGTYTGKGAPGATDEAEAEVEAVADSE